MAKTVALDWNAFMEGRIEEKHKQSMLVIKTMAGVHLMLMPSKVMAAAATQSSWSKVFGTVLTLADWAFWA
ncbi:hypothetical protein [Brevibacillus formosus]|uniref:hypothetical protein n=1 Tax=Brevibacillus formosus TaxID=54913 RepID=UPI003F1957CA